MSKKRKKRAVHNIHARKLPFAPMLGQKYKINTQKEDSKVNSEVMYSQDYDKFSILEQNRVVSDNHVSELVVLSMKNLK